MMYLIAAVLSLFNACCLALIILGLPGNWLMLGAAGLVLWWQWIPDAAWADQFFHPATLMVGAVLALIGEILELMLGAAGTKKHGGSRRGAIGALVGGLIGGIFLTFLIPIPLIGSLIGACLGAFAGAALGELSGGRQMGESLISGKGAAIGRFWGTVAKLAIGTVIWVTLAVAALI